MSDWSALVEWLADGATVSWVGWPDEYVDGVRVDFAPGRSGPVQRFVLAVPEAERPAVEAIVGPRPARPSDRGPTS